jgi:putative flippase GtrA
MIFFLQRFKKKYFSRDIQRFIIVGCSTVLLDCVCYFLLFQFGLKSSFSKGVSFTIGAIFAYVANKNFTFKNKNYGVIQFSSFILLYFTTLLVNVIINESILGLFSSTSLSLIIAFMSATLVSALLNFLGMKYLVFIR